MIQERGQFLTSTTFRLDGAGTPAKSVRIARKLRVQYPGAIYHVMNRGDSGAFAAGRDDGVVEVDYGASPDGRVDILEQPALLGTPGEPMKGHPNVIILGTDPLTM